MKVLITGGTGFIGSTVASACADAGMEVVLLDRHDRARRSDPRPALHRGELDDPSVLDRLFRVHSDIDVAVHCAAKTSIGDSTVDPLGVYEANVSRSIGFLRRVSEAGVRRVIFSSTASVYAPVPAGSVPAEEAPVEAGNPYTSSKLMTERVLQDAAHAGAFRAIVLRYANVIGADPRLRSGPPSTTAATVLGALLDAAARRSPFAITGTQWATRDGSALRDYVHVWDLALAHVAAIARLDEITSAAAPFRILNIGTGAGVTVRELVQAVERVTESRISTVDAPARPGDRASSVPDVRLSAELLGWEAGLTLEDGIRDTVSWFAEVSPER